MMPLQRIKYSTICFAFAMLFVLNGNNSIAQTDQQGDIISVIEEIRNAMPGINSNGFHIPSNTEKDVFGTIITNLKNQDFSLIQSTLSLYGYTFIRFYNIPTAETLYMVKENIPAQRGWGTCIFKPTGLNDCTIEVPHPIWDTRSWNMGIRVFLRLNARWFIMAGTHRYANSDSSSDVAHHTQTIFHKAHQVIATALAMQIHGFGKSDPDYNGYPDIVISAGMLYPPGAAFTLKSKYESQGFTAGVFSLSTQNSLSRLGATTNKQGQWSNANSKVFIHIEHDTPLRTDTAKTRKVVEAIYQTYGNALAVQEQQVNEPAGSFTLFQNYPNPFNPSTTFEFQVAKFGLATIKIFDVTGREITTILNEQLAPGIYTRTWNAPASHTASGIYLLSMSVGNETRVRKIALLK